MKIRHHNTKQVKVITRYDWEVMNGFSKMAWEILDEGDPVLLYEISGITGEHIFAGKYDRDKALQLIQRKPEVFYLRELSKVSPESPNQDLIISEFHNKQNKYPKRADKTDTSKRAENIIIKVKDLTNHQVVGGLIVAAAVALFGLIGRLLGLWQTRHFRYRACRGKCEAI